MEDSNMIEKNNKEKQLITLELLDHIEQLGKDGKLKELEYLNEQYLGYFYDGIEDSRSSLLALSGYIDIVMESLRETKTLKAHYPASFLNNRFWMICRNSYLN